MFNTHESAASKINGEIESLVNTLGNTQVVDEEYLDICKAIKDLATASATLVTPKPDD